MKIIKKENIVFDISQNHKPVINVKSGDIITIETLDARCGKMKKPEDIAKTEPDFSDSTPKVNPATGPIAIEEAEPGDAIKISIQKIEVDNQGFILAKPDFGVIGDLVNKTEAEFIKIKDKKASFKPNIQVPINPMVGLVATTPKGKSYSTANVGKHGGNIDCKQIQKGSKVYLPVFVPGGLLYIGDIHALMGDGEVSGTGIEIGGKVTVKISVVKQADIKWPYLETDDLHITLGSGKSFYKATRIALENMIDFLENYGFSRREAYMFCSAVCDVRLNQACNSPIDISVRVELPKSYID